MKRLAAKFRPGNEPPTEPWSLVRDGDCQPSKSAENPNVEKAPEEAANEQFQIASPLMAKVSTTAGLRHRCEFVWHLTSLWLARQLRKEVSERAGFLWVPVLIGTGILIYFSLPREPWSFAFPMLVATLIIPYQLVRSIPIKLIVVAAIIAVMGVIIAQVHAQLRSTVLLKRDVVTHITAIVKKTEPRFDSRVRYTLAVQSLETVAEPPDVVRLTARHDGRPFRFGDVISGIAKLAPPQGPVLPGGYDFRFFSWHSGIGGTGFFLGPPKLVESHSKSASFNGWVSATRRHISDLLDQALPHRSGALATALIIGERSGIDEATNEALRKSGLAHILAISGLHMALVTLTMIGTVRLILAATPSVVLRYPAKKIAGFIGLIGGTFYLILSGANLSTQRAYIMVAVMLLAILMDRKALTMRNVALAAIVVLVIAPHALLHPGFQMSFAAAAALIATYEKLSERRQKVRLVGWAGKWSNLRRTALSNLYGLVLVPLVAGMATALFAAYHFYRIAPLGLLANVLAMPIVSVAVMPLALLSVMLMPFGLEHLTLPLLGYALERVVGIAEWVAELGVSGGTGQLSNSTLLLGSLGLLMATLARSQLKLLAIPCFLLIATMGTNRQVPDFIVAESGRQVGMINREGSLVLTSPRSEKFTTKIWKQAYQISDTELVQKPSVTPIPGRRCDELGCVLTSDRLTLVQVNSTARLTQDCLLADILVIPYAVPWACSFMPVEQRPLIIQSADLRRFGAHAIHVRCRQSDCRSRQIDIQTARNNRNRPWNRRPN